MILHPIQKELFDLIFPDLTSAEKKEYSIYCYETGGDVSNSLRQIEVVMSIGAWNRLQHFKGEMVDKYLRKHHYPKIVSREIPVNPLYSRLDFYFNVRLKQ